MVEICSSSCSGRAQLHNDCRGKVSSGFRCLSLDDKRHLFLGVSRLLFHLLQIWEYDVLEKFERLFCVGPVVFRVRDVECFRKFMFWETSLSFPLIDHLDGQKLSS